MKVKLGLLQLIVDDLELAYDEVAENVQESYCMIKDNEKDCYITLDDLQIVVTLYLDEEQEQEVKEALHKLIL